MVQEDLGVLGFPVDLVDHQPQVHQGGLEYLVDLLDLVDRSHLVAPGLHGILDLLCSLSVLEPQ